MQLEESPTPTDTHCPYCALQCAMTLSAADAETDPMQAPLSVAGRFFPTNRGGLCKKGWTSASVLNSPDRITEPMVRQSDGTFSPTTWEAALDLIAGRLIESRDRHGADSIGIFGGGGLTNEKTYLLGKFARVAIGTSRIDYNGRFCMSSAAAATNRAFGLDRGLPFPVADLDTARTILILGSNMADTMPPILSHLEGTRSAGGLIIVDPRRSSTARLTDDGAGVHLQPAPGTDLQLLLGLTHVVLAEGLHDRAYLAERTTGLAELERSVSQWWPERVQSVTGIPAWQIRQVARRLAEPGGTYILTGRGVEQHINGTDTATAAINLSLALGLPGRGDSGYGTVTGQGNGQGGREHGQKCDQLPGYRKITDPIGREHVAKVWGVDPATLPGPGLPAVELLASLGRPGGVRCLLVHASNVVVSAPNASSVVDGLNRLDLLVVCDFFFSETAALADIVLPVTQWAEEDGTMTNLEGRVLRRRAAITAPPGVRTELWILSELARRLGCRSTFDTDPAAVFDELARASAGGPADYSGISYESLDRGRPAYWPFPAGGRGTPRLFSESFAHPDGRARIVPVEAGLSAEPPAGRGELTLITGRLLEHYQSGAQTRRVPELVLAQPEVRLQIHPSTASEYGIADGDLVEVSNSRGTVRSRATTTTNLRTDTVFLPFHFPGEGSANVLTNDATDPLSSMPEFKTAVVRLRRLS